MTLVALAPCKLEFLFCMPEHMYLLAQSSAREQLVQSNAIESSALKRSCSSYLSRTVTECVHMVPATMTKFSLAIRPDIYLVYHQPTWPFTLPLFDVLLFSSTFGIDSAAFALARVFLSIRQALPYRASRPHCSEPSPLDDPTILLSQQTPFSGPARVTYAVINYNMPRHPEPRS